MRESHQLWRDLIDPRQLGGTEDPDAGLKEPVFESIEVPEDFGPVQLVVDEHKIKRFAFTQDDYSPWHLESSPFFDGARIGHAALLANDLLQLFTLKYAGSKVVGYHTEEQMWFDFPVRLGETVTLQGRYTDAYVKRGQGHVVMEAQALGEDGRSLIRHRGVEIMRTVPGEIAGRGSAKPAKRVTGEIPAGARTITPGEPDPRSGDVLEPLEKTIAADQAAVFSRIGEYVKNFHNDFRIARQGQLRAPVVQGLQIYGVLTELLVGHFGQSFFTSGWMHTKFLAPLEVFEPFSCTGLITSVTNGAERRHIDLEVWARRASDDRMLLAGWASVTLPNH
ncbi:MaoC family dehydratase [Nesterenkonia ebinurensis]|uniref:MaoC family dehydratase n=1 Tax=Nesterenkonia ebinurensis TaxID=2608252 RepID=UPI00123CEE98|nr:MaoC family dehydratase N-terminal domain-containing protein [Nesterenkonia ebinurensis]